MSNLAWNSQLRDRGLEAADPMSATIVIDAEPADVWAIISSPGNLQRCHPFCACTTVQRWPGVGSRDFITYHSGIRYQRDILVWLDGSGYDMEVGSPTKKTCRVLWRIGSPHAGVSDFSITVFPYLEMGWNEHERSIYLDRFFGKSFDHYLQCVAKGVQYHVTTGRDVGEDQFGSNPVFSARN